METARNQTLSAPASVLNTLPEHWRPRPNLASSPAPIGHGFHNQNFLINSEMGEQAVLRIFLSPQFPEACRKETAALRFLSGQGAPSLIYSSSSTNVEVNYLLEEFIPGHALSQEVSENQPSAEIILECADALRDLHNMFPPQSEPDLQFEKECDKVVSQIVRASLTTDYCISKWPAVHKLLFLCEGATKSLQHTIESNPGALLQHPVLCHGDVCLDNFYRRDADGKVIQLDWEFAHLGYTFEDLAALVNESKLSEELETVFLERYFRATLSQQQRHVMWAWKLKRSLSLFAIVVERLKLMDDGKSSLLDSRGVYESVLQNEIAYVVEKLLLSPFASKSF